MTRSRATWWGLLCLAAWILYVKLTRRRRRKRIEALERALWPERYEHELVRVPHYDVRVPRSSLVRAQPQNHPQLFSWPDIPSSEEMRRIANARYVQEYQRRAMGQANLLESAYAARHQRYEALRKANDHYEALQRRRNGLGGSGNGSGGSLADAAGSEPARPGRDSG